MWWNRKKSEPDKFLDLLLRSGLLDKAGIRKACRGIESNTLEELCTHLVKSGSITKWQCEKLRAGRHRGFYFEKYVLQDQLCRDDTSTTYLAFDLETNEKVSVRLMPSSDGTSYSFDVVDL
jgi:hypothetical protein